MRLITRIGVSKAPSVRCNEVRVQHHQRVPDANLVTGLHLRIDPLPFSFTVSSPAWTMTPERGETSVSVCRDGAGAPLGVIPALSSATGGASAACRCYALWR